MTVITIKMIQSIFGCTQKTATVKIKTARLALGKSLDTGNGRGEPVTVEQFNEVFGLNKTLKK